MIISIHIPKTGGESLRTSFSEEFGEKLFLDYGTYKCSNDLKGKIKKFILCHPSSIVSKTILNYKYKVIHGHFCADKYQFICRNPKFITFFRDPISRAASHYYQWTRHPDANSPRCREMILERKLSLREFCLTPYMINFYRRSLRTFDINDFTFIGLTETYEYSLKLFNTMFGTNLKINFQNQGNIKDYHAFFKEMGNYEEIKEAHKDNQQIYDQACRKFEKLYHKYL